MGRGFGLVPLADLAGRVEENGGGGGVLVLGVGLRSGAVALFAGGGGDDGKPDHALGGVLLLELLHIAAGIVFFDEGTLMIEPFEDDELAAEVGEFVGGALRVRQGEVGSGFAGLDGRTGRLVEGEGK